MKNHLLIFLTITILFSCQEDNLPLGFYDHQVVRLLAGGNAKDSTKTWNRTFLSVDGVEMTIQDCQDSIRLFFHIVSTTPDSVNCYQLTPGISCSEFDTLIFGGMMPSATDNIFTDSLLFRGGILDFMIVEQLTSQRFTGYYTLNNQLYRVGFSAQ